VANQEEKGIPLKFLVSMMNRTEFCIFIKFKLNDSFDQILVSNLRVGFGIITPRTGANILS